MVLSLQSLRKTYRGPDGEIRALDGVSLELKAGEFLAVKGPSGCGKTTLLLTAGGLLAPDSGKVYLDQEDLYALTPEERARLRAKKIGFVFQQYHLIPYLTVLENVLAASIAVENKDAQERATKLMERFGLAGRSHHVPSELSSGERQRTALARALLNEPMVVLADEATGNLDRANADAVLDYLSWYADQGGAVLLATHSEQAASRARRVLEMENGKILS